MTLVEDVKEACRACIDVKSWFMENRPKGMKTSATIATALLYRDPVVEEPTVHRLNSQGIVCPPDARELGRSTWTFLHSTAAYLPSAPTDAQRSHMALLLSAVAALYPCRGCGEHMAAYMDASPPDFQSRTSISRWLCGLHNEINQMLGKEPFDCDRAEERWKTGPPDASCS